MTSIRIALIDDQALVLKGLSALLHGYQGIEVALEAQDGLQALAGLAQRPVDVVVSDIRMPGMDGIALVRALREAGNAVPVILLTTFDDSALMLAAVEAGAQGFLLKDASPDHQAICAKSGVILEAVLDFLTLLYECNVPRRAGGHYTLGDLLPAIDGKLRKALRVEHRNEDAVGTVTYQARMLEPHLTELARIAQVRNVMGCHFNALSFDLLDNDAIAFGIEVLALTDALIDHETGWPRNGKSGSYWSSAGDTRRLHPLKRPS